MKRLFKNVLLVLLLTLGFVFGSLDVYAEEASSDVSRWTVPPIEKLTTSDGIDIVPDTSNVVIKVGRYSAEVSGEVILNVTIDEDYEKDEIVIAPEAFQAISREIYNVLKEAGREQGLDEDYFKFYNPFQAGDSFRVRLVITNLSKFNYYYEETSFEIFPTEPLVYGEKTGETTGDKFFNGIELPDGFTFRRAYNSALQALVPNKTGRLMTDDTLGAALKAKGYAGIEEYDKYLLDFYNEKYGTSYTRLDQFNKGIIREMFSDADPFYTLNDAYKKGLGITWLSGIPSRAKEDVDEALKNHGYNSPLEFILDYYNVSNISELTNDMVSEFFANGNESGSYAIETNKTMLVLAYNYFYNEGLGFYFDTKDENGNYSENPEVSRSDVNGGSYSIGSYLRDEKKGDEEILERAGILKSNSENTISGTLKNVGNYTPNAYLDYFFMVNLQLKYKAKTGNLIIRYVDREGNELLSDVTSTEMVGKNYQTNPEDILNYELVDIDGVELGEYIDGTIIVTYIYDKVGSEETGEITPPNTGVSTTNSGLLILSLLVVNALGASVVLRKNN
ncbi:MAG: MucBP domain-containing protein [Bacilli bacterium]|nr:MucBP domain-containing protein [Bacilli bacterium]